MTAFLLATLFLLITPGPGVLTTAGVGAAFGFRRGMPYAIGVVLGSLVVMAAVATGLAALVLSLPVVREVLLVASAGYLVWIAWKIATSDSGVAIDPAARPLGFANGAALSLINPKAYAVMTTLFSGFAFWPGAPIAEPLVKAAIFTSVSVPIHLLWLWLGAALKRLAPGRQASRAINYAMAAAMLGVVALAMLA